MKLRFEQSSFVIDDETGAMVIVGGGICEAWVEEAFGFRDTNSSADVFPVIAGVIKGDCPLHPKSLGPPIIGYRFNRKAARHVLQQYAQGDIKKLHYALQLVEEAASLYLKEYGLIENPIIEFV